MNSRRRLLLVPVLVLAALAYSQLREFPSFAPLIETPNPSIYAIGQATGWKVTGTGNVKYVLKKNGLQTIKSGELKMTNGEATIVEHLDEPAQLLLEVSPEAGGKPKLFGAAVEPRDLKMDSPRPADFDTFWSNKIANLRSIPARPEETVKDSGREDVKLSTIKMAHVDGTNVYGQMATPAKAGKYPAVLVVQWASPPYPLDKNWILWRAAQGFVVLNIEPHNVLPDAPTEYYENLPPELKNYTSIGQDDKNKSYFVEMYLRGVRAVDYLKTRPDWDGKTIIVTGGSMGGQQAIAIAGLCPEVTHLLAEEPAGCDLNGLSHGRAVGYPFFGNRDPKVLETARYIDGVNFASRIKAKSLIGMGFIDTVCPPAGIWIAFNQITAPKEACPCPEAAHNNEATEEQMKPYRSRAEAWFAALAKGEEVTINPNAGKSLTVID